MRRISKYAGLLVLAAAIAAGSGCSGRVAYGVRVHDGYYHDYHTWNDHEDVAYRGYLSGRHEDYRPFNKLNRSQQNDYWQWRHSHPD